ncbi:MAG: glycosyltransferase [Chloroflexaceae bacterium]|nr:glycosyltransferase [Chloroflexaceae bacterium]
MKKSIQGGLQTLGHHKKSLPHLPLVSVITVVYNGEKFLEKAINSVLNQTYNNIEYLIIDGGSTDSTLEIIKKYNKEIDYWVSEPDKGIYDAMNKGINLSSGEIVGILNSDDVYQLNALELSVNGIINFRADYSYGSVYRIDDFDKVVGAFHPLSKDKFGVTLQRSLYPHASLFVTRQVYFSKVGLFNTNYRIAADLDFMIRIHKRGCFGVDMSEYIASFRTGGVSVAAETCLESRNIAIAHGRCKFICKFKYIQNHILRILLVSFVPRSTFIVLHKLLNKLKLLNSKFEFYS